MGQDDLNVGDSQQGQTTVTAQVARFGKVNDILQRAISRYQAILTDLGAAGPSGDPSVQAVLQQIVASAAGAAGLAIPSSATGAANPVDGIVVQVIKNPGPQGTPDVTKTQTLVQQVGQALATSTSPTGGV